MALLDKVKVACRVTSTAYDDELTDLIEAGLADMNITDIDSDLLVSGSELDPLVQRAVITYCKMNFGYLSDEQYQKFKASYDEQKAQMLMSSNYTTWGG
jgi:hypothetical protein